MSPQERNLDALARELAGGGVSRRSALKRLAGIGLGIGAAMAPAGVAEAMAPCSGGRVKCNGKCCPENAKCKSGKCKCKSGFAKCGKKCVDLDTSVKHCGACGNACPEQSICVDGECTSAESCFDAVKNGTETDIDCGGDCAPCANNQTCLSSADCQSQHCTNGFCIECENGQECPSGVCSFGSCAPPNCGDGVKNGTETDIDCGGDCGPCADGQGCQFGFDCQSGNCSGNICQP